MKNKALILTILLLFCTIGALPKGAPWGNLKKIHFYESFGKDDRVLEHLELIDFEELKRSDRTEMASHLIALGDYYFKKDKFHIAEAFYKKVLPVSPDYWYLYNKLAGIDRANGAFFIGFRHVFSQLLMMLKSFNASFLLVNQLFNLLFFAALLVIFLFGGVLFIKYFKLAGNDLIIDKSGRFSLKKALILAAFLLWPLVFLSGWMIYPFLITGFLWAYLNENEKKAVKYMLIAAAAATVLYGMNGLLEKNIRSADFTRVREIYRGHRSAQDDYRDFDDELKVARAFSYYENGKYDTALDILAATGEDYKDPLKFNLMGNIYFRSGEITRSIDYYRESLLLDDKNKIALNNFALALLEDNDPKVFKSFAERFPEIEKYRAMDLEMKDGKISQGYLWKRLFNSSKQDFNAGLFLKGILAELIRLPAVYYILLFIFYAVGLPRILPDRRESNYCVKCSKIMKESSLHKSRKMCDECHQLFSIKDVIFLEAKILKEKELKRKLTGKYVFWLILSLLIPGLNFCRREYNRLFLVLSTVFYFLLGVAVVGAANFSHIYSVSPLALNFVGAAAIVLYLIINAFSVSGEENGI